jgi:hypothetical protein
MDRRIGKCKLGLTTSGSILATCSCVEKSFDEVLECYFTCDIARSLNMSKLVGYVRIEASMK